MNFQNIESFVCLAECLNFTEAARNLYISQPSLSRQIADLELELGVRLFSRTRRSVSLTSAGEQLLPAARSMVLGRDELLRRARQVSCGEVRRLTVGFPTYYETEDIMRLFTALPPGFLDDVDLVMDRVPAGTLLSELEANRFDLVVAPYLALENKNDLFLSSRVLFRHDLCVLLREDHPLAARKKLALPDILDETFIMLERSECPMEFVRIENMCRALGRDLNVAHYVRSTRLVTSYLLLGKGIAIAPLLEDTRPPRGVARVKLELEPEARFRENLLIWRTQNENQVVRDLLRALK